MKTMTKTISGWMRKGLLHFKKRERMNIGTDLGGYSGCEELSST